MLLTLPWPPSVNHYWRVWRGRSIVSEKGRAYKALVRSVCRGQRVAPGIRLAVVVGVHPPDNLRRDLDNLGKAPLDALRDAGVYRDDSLIDALAFVRLGVRKPGFLLVRIEPACATPGRWLIEIPHACAATDPAV